MSSSELVSKYQAIQYGALVAGVILVIVYAFNTYKTYISELIGMGSAVTPVSEFLGGTRKRKPITLKAAGIKDSAPPGFAERFQDSVSSMNGHSEAYHSDRLAQVDAGVWDPAQLSLEQSVFDSHRQFTDDAYVSTQGPNNKNVVRDDTNDVNPRVGLRRVDYVTTSSEEDARTVSSEYPDQIEQTNAGKFTL